MSLVKVINKNEIVIAATTIVIVIISNL